MAYPVGANGLSTLRQRSHWHADFYRVQRRDGRTIRVSTLDRKFVFRDEVYLPTANEKYDEASEAGHTTSDTELVGYLSPATVQIVDLQRGMFDDARVDQYCLDWLRGKIYLHQVWWVDDVQHNGRLWRAKLSGMGRFMEALKGSAYYSTCSAVLGDGDCRATVTTTSGTVTTVHDFQMEFEDTGITSPAGLFRLGSVRWATGNNKGTTSQILSYASGRFVLATPTRYQIRAGDTFVARPGCDGLATTCKNTFANLANFRGNERQKNAKQIVLNRGTVN